MKNGGPGGASRRRASKMSRLGGQICRNTRKHVFPENRLFWASWGPFWGHAGSFPGAKKRIKTQYFGQFWRLRAVLGPSWALLGLLGALLTCFGPFQALFCPFLAFLRLTVDRLPTVREPKSPGGRRSRLRTAAAAPRAAASSEMIPQAPK